MALRLDEELLKKLELKAKSMLDLSDKVEAQLGTFDFSRVDSLEDLMKYHGIVIKNITQVVDFLRKMACINDPSDDRILNLANKILSLPDDKIDLLETEVQKAQGATKLNFGEGE